VIHPFSQAFDCLNEQLTYRRIDPFWKLKKKISSW